jgi:iron(III) transport system ATP-binding protein
VEVANSLPAKLITSMFLGDRWEYLFTSAGLRFRAFGTEARQPGLEYWVAFPEEACWVFAAA